MFYVMKMKEAAPRILPAPPAAQSLQGALQ
jgi:hypothetical protein